jgi:hypothetical protein
MNLGDWEDFVRQLFPRMEQVLVKESEVDTRLLNGPFEVDYKTHYNEFFVYLKCGEQVAARLVCVMFGGLTDFTMSCNTWKLENGRLVMAAIPPGFLNGGLGVPYTPSQGPNWPPSMVPPPANPTKPPCTTCGRPLNTCQCPKSLYQGGLIPKSPAPLFDAYDVLKFLEAELPVATGMLSATNFFVTGIAIKHGDDYRDAIRKELPAIKAVIGDKIGFIHPDSKLICEASGTDHATGKFAVCLNVVGNETLALIFALVKP